MLSRISRILRIQALLAALVVAGALLPSAWAQTPPDPAPTTVDGAQATPGLDTSATLPPVPEGAPVIVAGHEVFRIRQREGSLSAAERADLLSKRLEGLATNPFRPEPEITVVDTESGTDILADGEVLVTVTDADAAAADHPAGRKGLAEAAAERIQVAVAEARTTFSLRASLVRLAQAAAAVLVLALLLWLVSRLFGFVSRRVPKFFHGQLVEGAEDFAPWRDARLARPAMLVLRLAQLAVWLIILVTFVPLLLAIFPRTRAITERLIGFVREPLAQVWQGLVDYLPNLGFVLVIVVLSWALIRGLHWFFGEVEAGVFRPPQFEPQWARTTANLMSASVVVLAIIMAFPYLPGSSSPAFQGVGLFLGLLLSLSSSSAVANIISGVIQTYTGSFEEGDLVRIGDTMGVVVAKRLLVTKLRTFKNEEISIPNAVVLSAQVVNLSGRARTEGLVLHTTVTIGYDVPWRQVHELLLSAARDVDGLVADPPPFVLQTSLNDYHVSYELNVYAGDVSRLPRLYSALHRNIQDRFNDAGVEIMSPAFQALRDGNAVTIPPEARPADYRTPGFRVDLER